MYDGKFRWVDDLPLTMMILFILSGIGLWKICELIVGLVIYLVTHLQWVG